MDNLNLECIGLYSTVSETSTTFYEKKRDIGDIFLLYKVDNWFLTNMRDNKFTSFTEQPTAELVISHLCKFGYQPAIKYVRQQKINTIL